MIKFLARKVEKCEIKSLIEFISINIELSLKILQNLVSYCSIVSL